MRDESGRSTTAATAGPWALAGVVVGAAGLALSYAVALTLTIRQSPVVAVAELVIGITPGPVAHWLIERVGTEDKTILVLTILALLVVAFAAIGAAARRGLWRADLGYLVLGAVGVVAVLTRLGSGPLDLAPIAIGLIAWGVGIRWLTAPLQRGPAEARRTFSRRFLLAAAVTGVAGVSGRWLGRGRRHVEEVRRLVRITGLTKPVVRGGWKAPLRGIAPWQTPADRFYLIHTAIVIPAIDPEKWSLRIHGMVEREVTLTYQDLLRRQVSEQWMTLNCVSNPVGGGLVGNAWWSGVPLAPLLAEAGVRDGADALKQTSHDGWTCGTPLSLINDGRGAMLALAMNGEPLPLEHGFPVRTLVPGLYGFVSACKWLTDIEVTRFDAFDAFWTQNGWSEQAPVKIASRIDVPRSGDAVPAGTVAFGGSAWHQHTGIAAVQVALDGGAWTDAEVFGAPSDDTWVQWVARLPVDPGKHKVRVRARGKDGEWQTGVRRDVVPDGATGWHTVSFTAEGK